MYTELEDILEILEEKFINDEQLINLWENENVSSVINCGLSGLYYGYTWYVVVLEDGTEYDVYVC